MRKQPVLMSTFVDFKCCFCEKEFRKERRHFNWNKKVGHNSFCSRKCAAQFRLKGKRFVCANDNCTREFYRIPSGISASNYCSRSCAITVNNHKYPKWPVKHCKKCQKSFRREGSLYCSSQCGRSGRFKYTKEEIVALLKRFSNEAGRIPAKREANEMSHTAINLFGSWNEAIRAAGFEPNRSHDNRMYKRSRTKALDGHFCDSISEAIIDNWLYTHRISHSRDAAYPIGKFKADWSLNNGKIFVEYFGLAKDSRRYDLAVKEKQEICRRQNIQLVPIFAKDLYPKRVFPEKLENFKVL